MRASVQARAPSANAGLNLDNDVHPMPVTPGWGVDFFCP